MMQKFLICLGSVAAGCGALLRLIAGTYRTNLKLNKFLLGLSSLVSSLRQRRLLICSIVAM